MKICMDGCLEGKYTGYQPWRWPPEAPSTLHVLDRLTPPPRDESDHHSLSSPPLRNVPVDASSPKVPSQNPPLNDVHASSSVPQAPSTPPLSHHKAQDVTSDLSQGEPQGHASPSIQDVRAIVILSLNNCASN